jgi:hypothetical protein
MVPPLASKIYDVEEILRRVDESSGRGDDISEVTSAVSKIHDKEILRRVD